MIKSINECFQRKITHFKSKFNFFCKNLRSKSIYFDYLQVIPEQVHGHQINVDIWCSNSTWRLQEENYEFSNEMGVCKRMLTSSWKANLRFFINKYFLEQFKKLYYNGKWYKIIFTRQTKDSHFFFINNFLWTRKKNGEKFWRQNLHTI